MENVSWRTAQAVKWSAGAVATVALGVVLYFFVPGEAPFYPRCWFHTLTGWQCPGCGGLRAAHQLMHGNLAEAFRYNPLVFFLMAGAGIWGVLEGVRRVNGRDLAARFRRPLYVWLLVGVLVAFGILRNVPFGRLAGLSH
jgi:hypothetical protein